MRWMVSALLGMSLVIGTLLGGESQNQNEQKSEDQKSEPKAATPEIAKKLAGHYTLLSGTISSKKTEAAVSTDVKKWNYVFTPEKITVSNPDNPTRTFVFEYSLDPKTMPIAMDMTILDGPEGTKGIKAYGIIEITGENVKLAYSLDKDKRPKTFEGKEINVFLLKKK